MRRHLLMQTLLGHLALLAEKHPRKANSAIARKAKMSAEASLRQMNKPTRAAA